MLNSALPLFRDYLRTLGDYAGARAVHAGLLTLGGGLLQGVGLLLIIPLLSILGLLGDNRPMDGIAELVSRMFSTMNLPYSLASILVIFALILAGEALFNRYRAMALFRLQQDFSYHLRTTLYARISRASWRYHTTQHSADSVHLLDTAVGRVASGTHGVLQLAVQLVQTLVYLAVAFYLSPSITVALLLAAIAGLVLLRPLNARMFHYGRSSLSTTRGLYRTMAESFAGLKLAKSYNRSDWHIAAFDAQANAARQADVGVTRASLDSRLLLQLISISVLCALVYVAVDRMSIGPERLLLMIFIANRAFQSTSAIQQHWHMMLEMLPAFELYSDATGRYTAHAEAAEVDNPVPPRLERAIHMADVSFTYGGDTLKPALSGISAEIPAARTTAIIGPSGAGKSTLADLLLGLILPDSGEIRIDDELLEAGNLVGWRGRIAYVPQDVYLFDGSIRDNLAWVNDRPLSDTELWRGLEMAAIDEFVRAAPSELETVVGERGVRLSGGERQRIALARALLTRPDVLVLDEATSALDHENEQRIREALESLHGKLTIVIIAHRYSTIRHADWVIALDQGRLAATGTWTDLKTLPAIQAITADESI